jgi:RNA polymerase sigma-70 factor (ECF subfamily)
MTPDDQIDRDLLTRALAGDIRSYRKLMDRYQPRLTQQALRYVRDQSDAEEVVQETFRRAYTAMPGFRGESAVSTWFYRIATNIALNRYWYWNRRRRSDHLSIDARLFEDASSGTVGDILPDGQASIERVAEMGELTRIITASMDQLEREHREILILRGVQDKGYEEIAIELGITVGTVKSRIARARDKLREIVEKSFPGFATFGPERTAI